MPRRLFRNCVLRHGGNRYVKSFPCSGRTFNFLTNNFAVPPTRRPVPLLPAGGAVQVASSRRLRIKSLLGTSENAVKTQIWTATPVQALAAVLRKRLGPSASLHTIMQALRRTLFDPPPPFAQLLTQPDGSVPEMRNLNRLNPFGFSLEGQYATV